MTKWKSRSNTHSIETEAEQSPGIVPPEGKTGLRTYRGAAIAAIFLAMTVLSFGDLIEIIPVFAPFIASPLFPFLHETHDILAAMLALYIAHRLTPAVGTMAMVWVLALHLPYGYLEFPVNVPELTRIALTGAAGFLGIYIISQRKQAEERLRLQATALDAAANAILIADRRGAIAWVNPAFTVLTGYTLEEAIGKNPRELIKSGRHDQSFYKNQWDTILSGQVWRSEVVNRRKDGSLYTEEETITPMRDGHGAVTHFIAIKQDITERKQADAALRESERMRRLVLDNVDEIIYMVEVDRDNLFSGQVRFVSDRVEKILGYQPEEFIRDPEIWFRGIHPDDVSALAERTHAIFASGQPGMREYRMRHRRTGDYHWIEDHVAMELDSAGGVIGQFGVARDVTEQRKTETALREREGYLANLMDTIGDAVFTIRMPERRIEYVNRALTDMFGYLPEEVIGQTTQIFYLDDAGFANYGQRLQDALARGQRQVRAELELRRKDGERLWSEVHTTFLAQDGQPSRVISVLRDITKRKQADKRLATQYAVARALAESATVAEAAPRLLQAVCEGLDWDYAEVWSILWSADTRANVLRCTGTWHPPSLSFPEFETATRQIEFPPGVGLPGRVWASGEPAWIPDVTQNANFPRAPSAAKEGLRAGFAFPIQLGDQVLGVMGFFSRETRPPDNNTLQMLTSLSSQISYFIGGKQAVEALRESEERYRVIAEAASDVILVIGEDSRITFANPASENVFGYVCDEIFGQPLTMLMPEDLRPLHLEALKRYLNTGQRGLDWKAVEVRGRHKSGREFPIEVSFGEFVRDGKHVFAGIIRDITERKQREREVDAIATVSAALRTAPTRAEMLPVILDQLLNLLKADGAMLAMRDPATGETTIELGRGPAGASFTGVRLPPGEGITGHVIATGQTYLTNDVRSDPHFVRFDLLTADTHTAACAPLVSRGQIIGALLLLHTRDITAQEIRLLTAIADIAANAIHRATLYEQTERRLQRLTALRAVDMAISSSLDLRVTLNILLDQSTTHLQVDAADVLLLNRYTQTLDYAAGRGFQGGGITRSHLRLGECQAGSAALERRTIQIPNLAEETTFVRAGLLANENFVAHYVTPLIAKGEVKGVLEIFHRAPLASNPEWLDFLEALAGQAAIAIDNTELFDGMQRSNTELALAYDATIEGWSRAMDLRDEETEGHTQRVTELTVQLARAAGMSDEQLAHVRRGALLHDMGKLGVPDSILLKPGKLTDEEWVVMRQHPQFAFDMLSPIAYLRPALDIPYCHHERWDGAGYPRGLKGEQIPLAARLFAVVDVWDALRSDRPYRQGWPEEKVIEHIKAGSGMHFDPNAVKLFLRMVSE